MLRTRHALLASLCLLALPLAGACSTEAKLAGAGGECFQATDCEPGLVCVPQKSGSSQCSSDLSGVQSTESRDAAPAANDGAAKGDAAPKCDGGGSGDGGADATAGMDASPPPQDAAAKDSAPPPQDAAPPPDSAAADAPAD